MRTLARGLYAFACGHYSEAVELLAQLRHSMVALGGSHAQRDLLTQTLICAAQRAGQPRLALALLHERLAAKPLPRPAPAKALPKPAAAAHTPAPAAPRAAAKSTPVSAGASDDWESF